MPPPNFWRFKQSKAKSAKNAESGKTKQETISKFFALPQSTSVDTSAVHVKDNKRSADDVALQSPEKRCKISTEDNSSPPLIEPEDQQQPCTSSSSQPPVLLSQKTLNKLVGYACAGIYHEGSEKQSETNKEQKSNDDSIQEKSEKSDSGTKQKLLIFKNEKFTNLKTKNTNMDPSTSMDKNNEKLSSRSKSKYTPLEQQFMEIKAKYPDAVLFVECGYKYRFFGDDAETAAKELNIFCHMDHNFQTASIPTHRLYVHVRRLVANGHKVGVVKQMETAAIKAAGDNKSAPFTRELTALYTKATLIGEDVDPVFAAADCADMSTQTSATSHLTCVFESQLTTTRGQQSTIALVSVVPSTGDVVYDLFQDNRNRSELESRLVHLNPAEILLPQSASEDTCKMIHHLVALSEKNDDRIRTERIPDEHFRKDTAISNIQSFYSDVSGEKTKSGSSVVDVLKLDAGILCCLNGLICHLRDFNLHNVLLLTSNFRLFSTASTHMQLNACTVRNLELFYNATDFTEKGSLFKVMDHTKTRFGRRLLKQWIARPLLSKRAIDERLDAVEELACDHECTNRIRDIISKLPDLEKALATVVYGKSSTSDFYQLVSSLERVFSECRLQLSLINSQLNSALVRQLVSSLVEQLDGVSRWSKALNQQAAKCGDKTKLFAEESNFPEILAAKAEIEAVISSIHDHRREVRLALRIPSLEYVSVSGVEYLIEVKNNNTSLVPKDWEKISSTKVVSRFHSPFIIKACKRLSQCREQLVLVAQQAWIKFLWSFEVHYPHYRLAIQNIAKLDCLFSLASLAKQHGYTKPSIVDSEASINITSGRHPIVDLLMGEKRQFVPNDTQLRGADGTPHCQIVTGPNMGGKSSYIRQTALIAVMAQTGSYVPAETARIGIIDAIYTRMGARDDLGGGRSTFMVELSEASEILRAATPKSLVILDELGRGTSTHDGTSIAYATLKYIVTQVRCLCLFVTHYPLLAELQLRYPADIANYHMAFLVHSNDHSSSSAPCDIGDDVTFLYQLTSGAAARSYGLNVARLADIPSQILATARQKSTELEQLVTSRNQRKDWFRRLMDKDLSLEELGLLKGQLDAS